MHRHAGVYYEEFAHYIPIGAEGTVVDGEIKAIKVALLNLIPRIHNFNEAVILVDSKAVIQAVASNIAPEVTYIIESR